MDKILETILEERLDYSPEGAALMGEELGRLSSVLKPLLDRWIETGEEPDYRTDDGHSIGMLMAEYEMNYPAALATMDWILQDPEEAIQALKTGVL